MKKGFFKRILSAVFAVVFISACLTSCTKSVEARYRDYNSKSAADKSVAEAANGGKYAYDLTEYIDMPEYIGIEVPDVTYTPTDEDVENERYKKLSYFSDETSVTDGGIEAYDLVVADYYCTVDGYLYSDMCSNGQTSLRNFMVGVNEFDVPEIDDAMIGMTPGETKTVKFKFPVPFYKNVVLSGKEGEFTVTLETIRRLDLKEYDDDFVSEYYGSSDTAAYDSEIMTQLTHDYGVSLENYETDVIWDYLRNNIRLIEIPQKEYTEEVDRIMNSYKSAADASDMTVDEYALNVLGYENIGDFRDDIDARVLLILRENMGAYYIARCEGIYVADDEYYSALVGLGAEYETSDTDFCEQVAVSTYGSLENFRQRLLVNKVDSFLESYCIKIDTNEYFTKKANGEYVYDYSAQTLRDPRNIVLIVGASVAAALALAVIVIAVFALKARAARNKRVAEKLEEEERRLKKREERKARKELKKKHRANTSDNSDNSHNSHNSDNSDGK